MPADILVIDNDEVLLAIKQSSATALSICAITDCFSSSFSGIASTTNCAPSQLAIKSVDVLKRDIVAVTSSELALPFSTAFANMRLIFSNPVATASSLMSNNTTSMPACAQTCAMPLPIVPAPKITAREMDCALGESLMPYFKRTVSPCITCASLNSKTWVPCESLHVIFVTIASPLLPLQ